MPPETDNLRLNDLYTADQRDREAIYTSAQDIAALKLRDQDRRRELATMISQGGVNTSNDLYHAAVLLLHGSESRLAAVSQREGW